MRINKTFANGSIPRPPVYRIPLVQLLVLLPVASVLYGVVDKQVGLSWLLGGLINIIPGAYFSYYAFRFRGARAAQLLLQSMYRGEVGKFILTLLGFALVFAGEIDVQPLAVFVGYGAMALLYCWLSKRLVK